MLKINTILFIKFIVPQKSKLGTDFIFRIMIYFWNQNTIEKEFNLSNIVKSFKYIFFSNIITIQKYKVTQQIMFKYYIIINIKNEHRKS